MGTEWMNPKRRFLSALFSGKVDRIPVGSPTSVITVDLQAETGCYFPEAHTDPLKMATLAAGGHEILGFDTILPYFSVHMGSPILGCEMDWGDPKTMPDAVTHPYKSDDDITVPSEAELAEVYSVKALCEAIKILREKYPTVAIIGKVMGPWTLGYNGFGVQDFLLQTIVNPAMIRRSLKKLAEITVMFGNLQVKAGADVICLPDHATGDLVSPEMYHDFLTALHKDITPRIGAPLILHICGNTVNRAQWFFEEGFDCFHYDTKSDVHELMKKIDNKISLIGGINNPQTLLFGTPDDVKKECYKAVEAGVKILAPECAIPLITRLIT